MNYRDLEPCEIIQEGDEYLNIYGEWWVFGENSGSIGTEVGKHRRCRRPIPYQASGTVDAPESAGDASGPQSPHPADPKGEAGAKKCPLHLIPVSAMEETAWVHHNGSVKYGPFNWRASNVNANTYVAAIMRHLNQWREGQDLDEESGLSHLAHIAASCNILMDAKKHGHLIDDRVKP